MHNKMTYEKHSVVLLRKKKTVKSITSCAMMLSCWSSELGVLTRLRRLPAAGGDVITTENTTKQTVANTMKSPRKH